MSKSVSRRLALFAFLVIPTLGLGIATLCAALGGLAWPLELFSQYRPQSAGLALVALVVSILFRHRPIIVVNVALLVANLVPIFPHLMAYIRPAAVDAAANHDIRLLSLNMRAAATNQPKFAALLAAERPDVILLTEMPSTMAERMAPYEAEYPHRIVGPAGPDNYHEIGLYSRWPIKTVDTRRANAQLPVVAADLCPPDSGTGACLHVIALHAMSPFGEGAALRDKQLAIAASMARIHVGPTVIIGDLNATPWSDAFQHLIEATGLKDASELRGLGPTWAPRSWSERVRAFTESIAPLAGLSIDHALVSDDIAIRTSRIGPAVGSDHWPIIVDLQLPDFITGVSP